MGSAPPRLTHLALYDVTDWRKAFAVVARLGQNVTHLEMFEDSDMTEDWQVPLFMWRRFANSLPRLTSLRASALLQHPNFATQHPPPILEYLDLRPIYFTSNYLLLQRFIDPSYLPDLRTLEVLDLWFPLYARITKPDEDPSYLPRDKADFNATVSSKPLLPWRPGRGCVFRKPFSLIGEGQCRSIGMRPAAGRSRTRRRAVTTTARKAPSQGQVARAIETCASIQTLDTAHSLRIAYLVYSCREKMKSSICFAAAWLQ